jgi:hypothetical protein
VNATEPALQAVNGCLVPVFADGTQATTNCIGEDLTRPTRTAHPGDTIVFYGIGFGPVTPSAPDGQIVTQLNQLQAAFGITWQNSGVTTAGQVTYAGLARFDRTVSVQRRRVKYTAGTTGTWTFEGVAQGTFPLLVIVPVWEG